MWMCLHQGASWKERVIIPHDHSLTHTGIATVIVGHPFDTLKLRAQTAPPSTPTFSIARSIWASSGVRSTVSLSPSFFQIIHPPVDFSPSDNADSWIVSWCFSSFSFRYSKFCIIFLGVQCRTKTCGRYIHRSTPSPSSFSRYQSSSSAGCRPAHNTRICIYIHPYP